MDTHSFSKGFIQLKQFPAEENRIITMISLGKVEDWIFLGYRIGNRWCHMWSEAAQRKASANVSSLIIKWLIWAGNGDTAEIWVSSAQTYNLFWRLLISSRYIFSLCDKIPRDMSRIGCILGIFEFSSCIVQVRSGESKNEWSGHNHLTYVYRIRAAIASAYSSSNSYHSFIILAGESTRGSNDFVPFERFTIDCSARKSAIKLFQNLHKRDFYVLFPPVENPRLRADPMQVKRPSRSPTVHSIGQTIGLQSVKCAHDIWKNLSRFESAWHLIIPYICAIAVRKIGGKRMTFRGMLLALSRMRVVRAYNLALRICWKRK
jgi:hypothetical protein